MKDDPVLNFLRQNSQTYVSGQTVSAKLGVTRAAVWKEMENLRKLGYRIDARSGRGYRLTGVPDKMFADEIAFGLKAKVIGKSIVSYDELDSTNDAAWRLGEQGVKEGTCVFAEFQKKGRGRLGRHWVSPKGKNILLSILLRPRIAAAEASKLTLMTAVSAAKAVEKLTGKKPGIKWPNDILFENKKLCGVLTEMSAELDRVKFVVIGIGVNVNSAGRELPPGSTSLKEIAGRAVSRQEFARVFLARLDEDYQRLKDGKFESIAAEWEDFSVTSGRRITATVLGRKIHGQAAGIDADGALWIRKDNGLQERILAGDVHHVLPGSGR